MSDALPIRVYWDGEIFTPDRESLSNCALLAENVDYIIEPDRPRNWAAHKHQFAWLRTAFLNLPEIMTGQFRNEDHLRKFALIKRGYCTQRQFVVKSSTEANRSADMARALAGDYAIILVERSVVTVFEAESQSEKAMGGQRFAESKKAILDYIAGMIGVDPDQLEKETE